MPARGLLPGPLEDQPDVPLGLADELVEQLGDGGNIRPWTARISAGGKITVVGAAARTRTAVPRLGMTNLAKRFDLDRFFALPAKIRCRKQLPDFATVWITARRGTKTHTVDAQLGCSARFDSALGALRSVSRVKAP